MGGSNGGCRKKLNDLARYFDCLQSTTKFKTNANTDNGSSQCSDLQVVSMDFEKKLGKDKKGNQKKPIGNRMVKEEIQSVVEDIPKNTKPVKQVNVEQQKPLQFKAIQSKKIKRQPQPPSGMQVNIFDERLSVMSQVSQLSYKKRSNISSTLDIVRIQDLPEPIYPPQARNIESKAPVRPRQDHLHHYSSYKNKPRQMLVVLQDDYFINDQDQYQYKRKQQ